MEEEYERKTRKKHGIPTCASVSNDTNGIFQEQSGTKIQTTSQGAEKRMEIHDQRSCDRDQDVQDQGTAEEKEWLSRGDICEDGIYDANNSSGGKQKYSGTDGGRDKEWSCTMSTADAENQKYFESSSKDEIWQRQMMTPPGEKGAYPVEASSGERPFSREVLKKEDMVFAGMKWTKRKGIWTKNATWQKEEACAIDPDLFPLYDEKPETKRRMDWTRVNGIWTKFSEQDPDIPADILEEDPDILANLPKKIKLTKNVLAKEMVTTLPLKRLRKKTTPNTMHIMQNNNITVAYATPLTTTTSRTATNTHRHTSSLDKLKTSIIPQHKAIVTRGDLLSTSKYYKYHKTMGHTPQHIQHVAGSQRKRLLAESGLPTHMHKQVYLIHDTSARDIKRAKMQTNRKASILT